MSGRARSILCLTSPFPQGDPLYGEGNSEDHAGITLGSLALRGERGVLKLTPNDMLRQHWNPFYSYMEERIFDFFGLEAPPVDGTSTEPRAY